MFAGNTIARRVAPRAAGTAERPAAYCPIPQSLIADLHDTPLAIGLYALIGRLFLVAQSPIPLSRADVMRYDTTLKTGAVKRAFDRLLAGGWLNESTLPGSQKGCYTPTWGRVKGAPLPWRMDEGCLGRPRHIARLCLDRALLDVCMGKLTPHATRTATITRHLITPALSLADVGAYALTLAGIPHETPALRWLVAVRDGHTLPLPDEKTLLSRISQGPLILDAPGPRDTRLSPSGLRRMGLAPLPADATTAQPLFFVPPGMIGASIGPLIGSLIGPSVEQDAPSSAPAPDEMRSDVRLDRITRESRESREPANPPPTPPVADGEGGGGQPLSTRNHVRKRRPARADAKLAPTTIPDTESARALQAINVKPAQVIELADLPIATVEAAIADGKARPNVRDLAGWVVSLLRAHRDHGWEIRPLSPDPYSPQALGAYFAAQAALQREADEQEPASSGTDADPALEPAGPEEMRQEAERAEAAQEQDLDRVWRRACHRLERAIGARQASLLLHGARLVALDGGYAFIEASDSWVCARIARPYQDAIRDALLHIVGKRPVIRARLANEPPPAVTQDAGEAGQAASPASPDVPRDSSPKPDAQRPDWIAPDRWGALPPLLRAALRGSALRDGAIVLRSVHLRRVLDMRYAADVRALLAAVEDARRVAADGALGIGDRETEDEWNTPFLPKRLRQIGHEVVNSFDAD